MGVVLIGGTEMLGYGDVEDLFVDIGVRPNWLRICRERIEWFGSEGGSLKWRRGHFRS